MRKKSWLLLYFTCFYLQASAQEKSITHITYIAPVPLVIESGLLVDSMTEHKVFNSLTGNIKLYLAGRNGTIESDGYIKAGKPIAVEKLNGVEYRFYYTGQLKKGWTVIKQTGPLLDTLLPAKDSLVIQFRFKHSDSILQQLIFTRPKLLPVIIRYREKTQYDSIDTRIKSKKGIHGKEKWVGYETMIQSTLNILPGSHLELIFKDHFLTTDSCILYRLNKKGTEGNNNWKRTGHLLTLNELETKHDYTLDVKYMGVDAFNSYHFAVQPYWYQTNFSIIVFAVLGLFAIFGIPYLIYRYILVREKRKRVRVQEQLKTVQSQLNPHFIYNALSSIESLVTSKENELANEYLSNFSDLMRDTLRNSDELFISLSDEIGMLEKYISIEQLRFEFRCILEIDPALDLDQIEFPPMLLQPSVENAVKHGVWGMGHLGMIRLCFLRQEKDLIITIEDNGKENKHLKPKGTGHGIPFTRERMDNLKKLYKKEKLDFDIAKSLNGTIVTFRFQNWL